MSVGDPIQTLAERISTPKGCKKGLEPSWIRFGIIGPPISGSRSDMINYLSELAVRYSRPSTLRSRQGPALSIALFLILFAILVLGPAKTAIDTKWAIPTAMSLIRGNMGDISEFVDPNDLSGITTYGERRYNYWPMGAALLAVPIVAAINLFDPNFEDEIKSFKGPGNKIIGSVFGAITGTVFFWMIYAQFANVPIAILSTLVLMFCTSIWSIATRALWSQGPMVLTVVIAMLLLLRARTRPSLAQYVSLPLAVAFVIRPTAVAPIVTFSLYILLVYHVYFIKYIAWAAFIAVPWIAFNLFSFGMPLPVYYFQQGPHGSLIWWAFAAQLISPNRGLLIFSPVLLFSLSGFVLAMRARDDRGLHLAFAATVVFHLLIVSSHANDWWGGWTFGPRFMIDILPYMAYFFAFNLRAIVPIDNVRRRIVAAAIGLLALVSALIHAHGAYSSAPDKWNAAPTDINHSSDRVWDWADLQFTRGISFMNPRDCGWTSVRNQCQ